MPFARVTLLVETDLHGRAVRTEVERVEQLGEGAAQAAPTEGATVGETIEAWDADMLRRGQRQRTRAVALVCKLCEDLGGVDQHNAITLPAIRGELARRRKRGITASTHDNQLSTFRSFLRFAVQEGHRQDNPAADIRPIGPRSGEDEATRPAWTLSEVEALIEAAEADQGKDRPRYSAQRSTFYRLLWAAALRYGEANTLCTEDVQSTPEGPVVVLRASRNKSRVRQAVPITPGLAADLRGLRPEGGRIWPTKVHERVLYGDAKTAGVPLVNAEGRRRGWHGFRSGRATQLAREGVHPQLAQRLLRHSNVKITLKHYTQLDDKDLRDAIGAGVEKSPRAALTRQRRSAEDTLGDPMTNTTKQPGPVGASSDRQSDQAHRAPVVPLTGRQAGDGVSRGSASEIAGAGFEDSTADVRRAEGAAAPAPGRDGGSPALADSRNRIGILRRAAEADERAARAAARAARSWRAIADAEARNGQARTQA